MRPVDARRAWLCGLLLTMALSFGCARRPPAVIPVSVAPAAEAAQGSGEVGRGGEEMVVQVLWRGDDLLRSGGTSQLAAEKLADELAMLWTGHAFPFDAWADLAADEPVEVVALPRAGPLARAVAARLTRVASEVGTTRLVEKTPEPTARSVWVVAPRWSGDHAEPDAGEVLARWEASGGRPPEMVLVDLIRPEVDDRSWEAGEAILATSPEAAAVVAEHVLASRASGRVADPAPLAAKRGLRLELLDWRRVALRP